MNELLRCTMPVNIQQYIAINCEFYSIVGALKDLKVRDD